MRKLKLHLKVKLNLKQKKLTTNEKELTKEEVEAKNLEIRLLKPVAGFAKAMDSETDAEFFSAPAGAM